MTDAKKTKAVRKRNMLPIIISKARGRKRFVVDLRSLKGESQFFSSYDQDEAETVAKQKWVELQNGGIALASISDAIKTEAAKCAEILKPHGASLTEAVDHYVKTVLSFRNAPTISEIIDDYLLSAKKNGRRTRTIMNLRSILGRFSKAFPDRKLSSITLPELEKYIDNPSHGMRTRSHTKVKISQLYNFAIRKGWCSENLTKRLESITPEDKEVTFFTVEQAASILEHADDDMLPPVAIGLFAGLRQSELNLLDWSAIKLSERVIRIAGKVAKKRSRGLVTISDTLADWITPYAKTQGKLIPFGQSKFEVQWRKLRKAAGVTENNPNGMRHSFGTYFYAMTGEINRTCVEMREKNPVVMLNHYRGLAKKSEGERYFALRPATEGKVIAIR
jgi:integrase